MSDLVPRTRAFALRCLKVADSLPRKPGAIAIAHQLARSGTSTAADYRAAQKARSKAEFKAKLQIAMEEADESQFWLGLAAENWLLAHGASFIAHTGSARKSLRFLWRA